MGRGGGSAAEDGEPAGGRRRRPPPNHPGTGLCPRCAQVRVVVSDRGSTFYMCRLAARDPRYRRYPPQPVLACPGFSG